MSLEHVFRPLRIGPVELKNRIELGPALPGLASFEGLVTREMIAYYRRLARGGAAVITIGETPIDREYAGGHGAQVNLGSDRVIPGLSVLAEEVHRYGAVLSVELCHRGRQRMYGDEVIGPSPIPPNIHGRTKVRVREMTQEDIDRVIENFAAAAERCVKAGVKMIMLHGGHGHLLAQFLSPWTNKRLDSYGGSLENRARFAIEVLSAIRERVGNKLAIEYRISANELVPGGMEEEEIIQFVKMIEDKIDLLHVSAGVMSDPAALAHMIRSTYFSYAYNVPYAERFKKALRVPITTIGSIMDLETAERILAEGKADVVAMVRAILADPDHVNKVRQGRAQDVRPCLRCLTCLRLTAQSLPIRCSVNPTLGRELDHADLPPARQKKKVLVVGGGPAGMQAALTAAARGHEVLLYEKEAELGGNLRLAAAPTFKQDMKRYLSWLTAQVLKTPGITVKLNQEATPEAVRQEGAEAVVVAVGADPIRPEVPGADQPNVAWAGDVLSGKAAVAGQTVVVVGGGLTGCETALHLAQQGKKVTIVDQLKREELAPDAPRGLMELLEEHQVTFVTEAKLEAVTEKGVVVVDRSWRRLELPAEAVVLSLGFRPRREVAQKFEGVAPEVYVIGDCRDPQNLKQAVHDGFNVAVEL
ncbi:MAG: FAD-dependent oxidoreductase [Moorellales bacterium]